MFNFETMAHPVGSVGTVNGVMVAQVTNNQDPDKLGRVKVKFMIHETPLETDWVPIASLMSGKDRGTLFVPDVGDEVLVAFQFGHLSRPYVIGCLWNQKNQPPAVDEKNNLRKIRTRSGHELLFDDTDNAGKVTIKTAKGMQVSLEDKEDKLTIGTKDSQHVVTLSGSGSGTITIKSGSNKITITGQGDIQLESTKAVTIKSTQMKLEATGSMEIKSTGTMNIEASMLTLKGSLVKIN
jgi:uncharacterized protein involved in type VI secretion and phage assembly